ncbi:MAG: hypothetical protein AB1779_08965, partial [Candidatus Thermoplasmatota archaeon]
YSYEDIANVVNEAKFTAIRGIDLEKVKEFGIRMKNLTDVISKKRGTITMEIINRCMEFKSKQGW